jgi:hypothetical protein
MSNGYMEANYSSFDARKKLKGYHATTSPTTNVATLKYCNYKICEIL